SSVSARGPCVTSRLDIVDKRRFDRPAKSDRLGTPTLVHSLTGSSRTTPLPSPERWIETDEPSVVDELSRFPRTASGSHDRRGLSERARTTPAVRRHSTG